MFTDEERHQFILGYTDAMKWANTMRPVETDGQLPDPGDWGNFDLESFDALDDIRVWSFDHDSMVRIEEVCDDFMRATEPMLRAARWADNAPPTEMAQHGHDLALTQNHHGTGFWDRGYVTALGDALTDAAHAQGEASAYVSDEANGLLTYEG